MNEAQQIIDNFENDMKSIFESFERLQHLTRGNNSSSIMGDINRTLSLCNKNMERMTRYEMGIARQMESQIENAKNAYKSYLDAAY